MNEPLRACRMTDDARRLMLSHLSVARRLATGFGRTCEDLAPVLSVDDLYGEACLYLCELAAEHPPGVPFEGLAVVHVRHRLIELIRRARRHPAPVPLSDDQDSCTRLAVDEDVGWEVERADWIYNLPADIKGAQRVAALARLTRPGCGYREAARIAGVHERNARRGLARAVRHLYALITS